MILPQMPRARLSSYDILVWSNAGSRLESSFDRSRLTGWDDGAWLEHLSILIYTYLLLPDITQHDNSVPTAVMVARIDFDDCRWKVAIIWWKRCHFNLQPPPTSPIISRYDLHHTPPTHS